MRYTSVTSALRVKDTFIYGGVQTRDMTRWFEITIHIKYYQRHSNNRLYSNNVTFIKFNVPT